MTTHQLKNLCSVCEIDEAQDLHTCPAKMELLNDDETLCNCCPDCTKECANNI